MKKLINRDYLYNNTIGDAFSTLVEGIQIVKVNTLKTKKKVDGNITIYYTKNTTRINKTCQKGKKVTKTVKSKTGRKEK